MKIEINYEKPTDLIELNCPGKMSRQVPIWLKIDWLLEKIWVVRMNYTYAVPAREYYNIVSRFSLPHNVNAVLLKGWIQTNLIPLIEEAKKNMKTVWTDNGIACEFNEKGEDCLYQIGSKLFEVPLIEEGGLWRFEEWIKERHNVHPKMTDEELIAHKDELLELADKKWAIFEEDERAMIYVLKKIRRKMSEEQEKKIATTP